MRIVVLAFLVSISIASKIPHAADVLIPQKTRAEIRANAARDFPDNDSVQKEVIKTQTTAYNEVKTYKNKKVPVHIVERIKIRTAQNYPLDYSTQLFFINQQVNSYLKLGSLSSPLFTAKNVKCENLRWKLSIKGTPAVYRGTVKPDAVDVVYVEVRGIRKVLRVWPGSVDVIDVKDRNNKTVRTVKPGSVGIASVEKRNVKRVIGQGMGFPNPGGTWEITVWGDYDIRNRDREKFYCEKY
jgi:hypothetical protein